MEGRYNELKSDRSILKEIIARFSKKLKLANHTGFEIGGGSLTGAYKCKIGTERALSSDQSFDLKVFPEGLDPEDQRVLTVYPAANGDLVVSIEGGEVTVRVNKEDMNSLRFGITTEEIRKQLIQDQSVPINNNLILMEEEKPVSFSWKSGERWLNFVMISGHNRAGNKIAKISYAITHS